jgi:hypothetical protein
MRFAFVVLFVVLGALGIIGGSWFLKTGRNLPGLLGRGFTKGDNLRLKRAPAIYFRAVGATVISGGFTAFYLAAMTGLSPATTAVELVIRTILGALVLLAFLSSVGWLLVLSHRYKLFRWDSP